MLSIKTLLIGTLATALIFLFNQFIFILLAGYAGVWLAEYPMWIQNREWIWQAMGLITLIISMLLGGVLVSFLVKNKKALHGLIVGLLTSTIFILFARDFSQLNVMSIFIFAIGSLCTALAAHYMPDLSSTETVQD